MASWKSLDPQMQILAHLLLDVQTSLSQVITSSVYRKTVEKLSKRYTAEGIGFLTKALPSLGKALDKALSENTPLDATLLRFATLENSKLPKLFGELFQRVLSSDGRVLPSPCVTSIKALRHLLFVFYKLDVPCAPELEQEVLDRFLQTESDILPYHEKFTKASELVNELDRSAPMQVLGELSDVVRRARQRLHRLFRNFDPSDIVPCHGPGAVSTRERLWEKWHFRYINPRIQEVYPFDAYFCASLGHVCDTYPSFEGLPEVENFARVLLVPKDSRGPRLISCEPLCFQWVQQGLGVAIVEQVESHRLTRWNVHFTDQTPNRAGALLGSQNGKYSTLDLKDASDRVTLGLVRLLFPGHVLRALEACRTLATVMPNGHILKLNKYAPMGSALCFPVLALTVWAILSAGTTDADARESILVYGDDVIVKSTEVETSMKLLESFGLLVNRDKSCYRGFFRESCGMDAYRGSDVTPLRIKERWSSRPSARTYTSYLELSNNLCRHGFHITSDLIATWLCSKYADIPSEDLGLPGLSLIRIPSNYRPCKSRWNSALQKVEYRTLVAQSRPIVKNIDGWSMLLRYFTEGHKTHRLFWSAIASRRADLGLGDNFLSPSDPFSAGTYTRRDTSHLVKRWRG